jgi:hypothetical protein
MSSHGIVSRPISALTAPEILSVVWCVEARGVFETAYRILAAIGKVLRYGSATGRSCRDLTPDIHDALVITILKTLSILQSCHSAHKAAS